MQTTTIHASRWRSLACILMTCAASSSCPPAFAAHPLATEDAATQGGGNFELEIGLQRTREDAAQVAELGAQLSYGLADRLDLIVRPVAVEARRDGESGTERARGLGDTSLGFKWQFAESKGAQFTTRADVTVPTGRPQVGSGAASYRALLIATTEHDAWAVHGNVGFLLQPGAADARRGTLLASAAAVWSAGEVLHLSIELTAASPAERGSDRWPVAARAGAIAAVSRSVTVDVGYETRLARVGPQSVLLAGATLRW